MAYANIVSIILDDMITFFNLNLYLSKNEKIAKIICIHIKYEVQLYIIVIKRQKILYLRIINVKKIRREYEKNYC